MLINHVCLLMSISESHYISYFKKSQGCFGIYHVLSHFTTTIFWMNLGKSHQIYGFATGRRYDLFTRMDPAHFEVPSPSTHVISVGHHRVDEQNLSVTMRAMIHNLTYPLVYSNSLQWKIHIYNHFYREIIEIYKLVIFHEYMVNYRRVWHGEIS